MASNNHHRERLFEFFNKKGYQNILVARSDLTPPDVYLLSDGNFHRYGSLGDLVSPNALPDPIVANAPEFEQSEANSAEGHLSFSFLKLILRKFDLGGAIESAADAKYEGATNIHLRDVTIRSIPLDAIERALNDSFDPASIGIDRIKRGEVHMNRPGIAGGLLG